MLDEQIVDNRMPYQFGKYSHFGVPTSQTSELECSSFTGVSRLALSFNRSQSIHLSFFAIAERYDGSYFPL